MQKIYSPQENLVRRMTKMRCPISDIMGSTGLSRQQVQDLRKVIKQEEEALALQPPLFSAPPTPAPVVKEQTPLSRAKAAKATLKNLMLSEVLDAMPDLDEYAAMNLQEREVFWEESRNVLVKAALVEQDLKLLEQLIAKSNAAVKAKSPPPLIHIQPIEYSPILPLISMELIARDTAQACVELIKGKHILLDDINHIYSAIKKYHPEAVAHD